MQTKKKAKTRRETPQMIFSAGNFRILGLSVLLIIAGFTAMRLENEVYGFVSLYISPVVILTGYLLAIYAILRRRDLETTPSTRNQE